MKTRLLILLLCLSSLSVMGQGIITRNKPKQEQTAKKKETPKKETPAKKEKKQQPAAQKKEQSKPVAKKETPAKKTNPGNGASSRSGKQTATRSSVTVSEGTRDGDHYYVDLGLPSGTKWATTNVGASSPSDYGDYYAWGETSTKSSYTWQNLRYCLDTTGDKFSKYVTDSKYGTVDGKKELDPSDDAAYVNWGSGWRMPSIDQVVELEEKCKWTWTTMGGHKGYKVVGPNGNSLFLPAAGYRDGSELNLVGSYGGYWSRSLYLGRQWGAYGLYFGSGGVGTGYNGRSFGRSVRAVLGL